MIYLFIPDNNPRLRETFKELLPLAARWKTIGALLGVEISDLNNIKVDEDGADERLLAMIDRWVKQVDPLPTWAALADALESIDASKAQKIRQRVASR